MKQSTTTATGCAVPAGLQSSFAITQATWRFLDNERVTLPQLIAPLRSFARQQIAGADYVLAVTDRSKLDYRRHKAKKDVVQLTHEKDVGYELTTQLLVSAQTGQPIAPAQVHLKTADGFLSTATASPANPTQHLEQVLPLMRDAATMDIPAGIVHVIDREADSVFHLRAWHSEGFHYLVRGDDDRLVRWRNQTLKISQIRDQLELEDAFVSSREVLIDGKKGLQYVAETEIVLNRPAQRKIAGKVVLVPGEPLTLRLVFAKVVHPQTNEELSLWTLLSNVASSVCPAQLALWYYWRWKIETYFKLLKRGGQQMEHWQQESALAILKRLLIASMVAEPSRSMACAIVWSLQERTDAESEDFKDVLVRLSGKRTGRERQPSAEILLSGIFVLLQMCNFLASIDYDLSKIKQLNETFNKILPKTKKDV
jgi:hypothetical protein